MKLLFLLLCCIGLATQAAQQTINVGTSQGDGTGDSFHVGGGKINANFTELYNRTVNGHPFTSNITITPSDLGLVIGTNVQGFSSNLSSLSTTNPFIAGTGITFTGTWGSGITINSSVTVPGTDSHLIYNSGGAFAANPICWVTGNNALQFFGNSLSLNDGSGSGGGNIHLDGGTLDFGGGTNVINVGGVLTFSATSMSIGLVSSGVWQGTPIANAYLATTFTNKRITPRTLSPTYAGTITLNSDTTDAADITATGNFTLATPSGTPTNWQTIIVGITASGADRTVTLSSNFKIPSSSTFTSPFIVPNGTETLFAIRFRASDSKWRVVSVVPGY